MITAESPRKGNRLPDGIRYYGGYRQNEPGTPKRMPTSDTDTRAAAITSPTAPTADRPTDDRPTAIYLCTYNPLVMFAGGLDAIRDHGVRPYVDASCRPEPDLEHPLPGITALSQGNAAFALRLQPGDVVVYITTKARYENWPTEHWRLTAVLKVVERFESHEEAAAWYRANGVPLPGNCVVEGNDPVPLERTSGVYRGDDRKERVPEDVAEWDGRHWSRVAACGVFLACRPLYTRLKGATTINQEDVKTIFPGGKMPTVRMPSVLTPATLERLLWTAGVRIPAEDLSA